MFVSLGEAGSKNAHLFAALEIATGKVITDIRTRHTSADFIAFLNKVNREVPKDLDVSNSALA